MIRKGFAVFSTEKTSTELEEAFTAFLSARFPVKALGEKEERSLLEMSVAHMFWAMDRSKVLGDILVVSSLKELHDRIGENNMRDSRPRPRSGRDLVYASYQQVIFPLRARVPVNVMKTLCQMAERFLEGAIDPVRQVRDACREGSWYGNGGSREDGCFLLEQPRFDGLQNILVNAFLAEIYPGTVRPLEGTLQIALRCPFHGWADETYVVCRAPALAHVNEAGRLHRTDGFAVEFQDRTGLALVDGVRLPSRIFTKNHGITASDILDEENMEVRRVFLGLLGIDSFLREIEARVVARDDFGTLYHSDFEQDDWTEIEDPHAEDKPLPRAYVKLLNSTPEPGTDDVFKEYLLRVPPDIRTPRDAVAWSFGLDEEAYAPVAQT
jgi:hypothetical protein